MEGRAGVQPLSDQENGAIGTDALRGRAPDSMLASSRSANDDTKL